MCIHAALREYRQEGVIDTDGRHPRESVCGQIRGEPKIAQRGVLVSLTGFMHPINAETAGQKRGRSDGPVVLSAAVLDIGCIDEAITLVAANDSGCGIGVVVAAVTSADSVIG